MWSIGLKLTIQCHGHELSTQMSIFGCLFATHDTNRAVGCIGLRTALSRNGAVSDRKWYNMCSEQSDESPNRNNEPFQGR